MESTLKILNKLIEKFILPQYDDIYEYHITPRLDNNIIEITFWMDGTDQEIEEEIVDECLSVFSFIPREYKVTFRFTTEGDNFYEYS
jgi:mevalonate pyrophosphate decarboxylase